MLATLMTVFLHSLQKHTCSIYNVRKWPYDNTQMAKARIGQLSLIRNFSIDIYIYYNVAIKHGFSCINIRQLPWEVLKTKAAKGLGFQHLPRDLANVNALKKHV